FISVGMMVRPSILAEYWLPILILSAVVIVGMIIFGTAGMLITGQSLRTAIQAGFSLSQIGEFAFIIASLGLSLGVLNENLYPIVVAVSVITTFTTPYFIKMSDPVASFVERHLPAPLHFLIDRYRIDAENSDAAGRPWGRVIKQFAWRIIIYSSVLLAIQILMQRLGMPYICGFFGRWGKAVTIIGTLALMSPFLIAMLMPLSRDKSDEDAVRQARIPSLVMMIFSALIALGFVVRSFTLVYSMHAGAWVVLSVVILLVLFFSRRVRTNMNRIENTFLDNLNERELRRSGKKNAVVNDLHQAYMTVGTACRFLGERLMDSDIRNKYGVNLVGIQRGARYLPIPNGRARLYPGDVITVIGTDEQLGRLLPDIEADLPAEDGTPDPSQIKLTSILLSENSPLISQTPRSAALRDTYDALVVAVDRGDKHIDSQPDLVFMPGDIVWLVGNPSKLANLK
ncbi:MAG: cation:proton antiporter, partial [Muribaculaceae bacterium]|nr:cation:proton antiporter [Muribaculaceae bacterium]